MVDVWLIGPLRNAAGDWRLHWLTPLEHGHCPFTVPLGDALDVTAMRQARRSAALEDRWPQPVVAALLAVWKEYPGERIIIRLAVGVTGSGLPDDGVRAWRRTSFEGLTLDGQPVTRRAVLERETTWNPDGLPPVTGDAFILNTWFPLIDGDPQRVVPAVGQGIRMYMGHPLVADFLTHEQDLRSLSALAVIAHGASESDTPQPKNLPFVWLVDRAAESQISAWTLPDRQLPPLVAILACSSERLDLPDYASSLLERGAQCVLVPTGRIDAKKAAAFIGDFLRTWRGGASVIEALDSLRPRYHENLLDRLWIMGNATLRYQAPESADHPEHLSAQGLAQALEGATREYLQSLLEHERLVPYAAAILANRATLKSVFTRGSLLDAVRIVNTELGAKSFDDETGRRLYHLLEKAYPFCSPITQGWLANYLMGLSERFDHAAMRRYRQDPRRESGGSCGVPSIMHYTAVAEARGGHFVKSALALARGFEILDGLQEDFPIDRLTLSGTIVNHFIDFNLPEWALKLIQRMQTEMEALPQEEAAYLGFTSRDRQARANLRSGNAEAALAAMGAKRAEAMARGENGYRELAWLVFMAAWCDREPTPVHFQWMQEALQVTRNLGDALGRDPGSSLKGNDDLTYLLRALAVWNWAHGDDSLHVALANWIATATMQIERGTSDPGPWGFFLGYLAAAGSDDAARHWPVARSHLLQWEYRLEVLGLEALTGLRAADQTEVLDAFQRTRARLIEILGPVLRRPDMLGSVHTIADIPLSRSRIERETLENVANTTIDRKMLLMRTGLTPM